MLYHANHNSGKVARTALGVLGIMILVGFVVLTFLRIAGDVHSADAQEAQVNMKALFQRLDQRMIDEPGFLLIVRFVTPLNSIDNTWTLGDPDDPRHPYISEVGDDYVCFREKAGGTDGIRCTPFYNIASVAYLTE